jgi:hypothetical protein
MDGIMAAVTAFLLLGLARPDWSRNRPCHILALAAVLAHASLRTVAALLYMTGAFAHFLDFLALLCASVAVLLAALSAHGGSLPRLWDEWVLSLRSPSAPESAAPRADTTTSDKPAGPRP